MDLAMSPPMTSPVTREEREALIGAIRQRLHDTLGYNTHPDDFAMIAQVSADIADLPGWRPAPAAPAAGEWRPISDEAKMHPAVLLWSPLWECTWGVQLGSYDTVAERWETTEGAIDPGDMDSPYGEEGDDDFEPAVSLEPTHWQPLPAPPSITAVEDGWNPAGAVEVSRCFICSKPLYDGDMVLGDVSGETGHRDCYGDDRESFVRDIDTGEPLRPDDHLPNGYRWTSDTAAPPPPSVAAGGELVEALEAIVRRAEDASGNVYGDIARAALTKARAREGENG
jgi:hypothetical protein